MNQQTPVSQTNATHSRARKLWFRLAAIAAGLLPLVILEFGLRLTQTGKPAEHFDPLAGFNRQQKLFEKRGDAYHTARAREPFFNPQQFAARKATNGFRIFCFGGSTIFGHPYLSETALPKWLELELATAAPDRKIEAINCGGISYASYRLAPIVREVLDYEPDLIILATGENEFLEDRTYQRIKAQSSLRRAIEDRFFSLHTTTLLRQWLRPARQGSDETRAATAQQLTTEVNARLDDARSGYASYHRDLEWRGQVINQFEDSMRAMIADCRRVQVPLILVTLGSNLRDCPPYKSEHKINLAPDAETRWQAAFDAGTAAEAGDPAAALAHYQAAETIDSEHALLSFRMARILDQFGRIESARQHYLRAKDQDICPLRMLDDVYELQHLIGKETATPLVDARRLLESLSPEQLPGNDLYLDHVHPTIGGNQLIARAVAARIFELRLVPEAVPLTAEQRRNIYRRQLTQLDATYFSNGRRRVEWLENWAQRQKLAAETTPKDARGFLHQGFRTFELGAAEDAWKAFLTALEMDPSVTKPIIARALQLRDEGRTEAAQQLLDQLARVVIGREVKADIEKASAVLRGDRATSPIEP